MEFNTTSVNKSSAIDSNNTKKEQLSDVNDISFTDHGYYIIPSLDTLNGMPLVELRSVNGLVVGHKDYGKVEFLEPVDLVNVPLNSICDKLIHFEPKTCILYPNSPIKPKKGEGMNVPAKITCFDCFPINKSTREPILDANSTLLKNTLIN